MDAQVDKLALRRVLACMRGSPSSPFGARVWLACGRTDMRKGMDGLAMLAQQVLNEDPFDGALFAFRGRRGLVKSVLV